jgi:hypothetical protein
MTNVICPRQEEPPIIHPGGVLPLTVLGIQAIAKNFDTWSTKLDFGSLPEDLVLQVLRDLRRAGKLTPDKLPPFRNCIITRLILSSTEEQLDLYLDGHLSKHLTTLSLARYSAIDDAFLERTQVYSRIAQLQMLQTLVLDYTQVQVDSLVFLPKTVRQLSLIGAGSVLTKGRISSRHQRQRPVTGGLRAYGTWHS